MSGPISYEALAREIRSRRQAQRLSQADLGEAVGCSQAAISQFENGAAHAISPAMADRICAELGIQPAHLPATPRPAGEARAVMCANAHCPWSTPFMVGHELHFKPTWFTGTPSPTFCPGCGTPTIDRCANSRCQAPLSPHASFCTRCGQPYVQTPPTLAGIPDPVAFIARVVDQQRRLGHHPVIETPPTATEAAAPPSAMPDRAGR